MLQIRTAKSSDTLRFNVHRRTPELITPIAPTPHEFKPLSDLDSLKGVRIQIPTIHFYPCNPSMNGIDPVNLIRKALVHALVFYYPFAGRLREDRSGALIVECNGEGILFIEADANVTLSQFGYPLVPLFPCFDQLLFDVPDSSDILNCPLLLIQVTRLKCGGFIIGIRLNHTMCDAQGLVQFLFAVAEIARGATCPSVLPTWERHVLNFPNPPQLLSTLPENNIINMSENTTLHNTMPLLENLCYRFFLFGPSEISTFRKQVPLHLRSCTSFEIISACVWKCRDIALQPHPTQEMSYICLVNLRGKLKDLIPVGYYGNAVMLSLAKSTAKEIVENPLSYTLQLVQNAKNKVKNIEHQMEPIGSTMMSSMCYTVSDLGYARFEEVDFGWGNAVYAGPCILLPMFVIHLPFKKEDQEIGITLAVCLPNEVMERFELELTNMLKYHPSVIVDDIAIISKM